MQSYIIRRLLLLIPTVVIVTIIVFFLVRFIPGSVVDAMLSEQETFTSRELTRAVLEHKLGLDVPVYTQYGRWVWGIISRGDMGRSLWTDLPVFDVVISRLPISFELGILAITIAVIIGIPLGVFSAIRQDSVNDYLGRSTAILFLCLPTFWLATLVVVYPSIWWHWVPSLVYIPLLENPLENLGMFIIPAAIVGLHSSGSIMRMMRTTMLDVLRQDYIRTAWAKGLQERTVIVRHALKNALVPVVTTIGLHIPMVIGGLVIMEQIFNLPGMGRLLIDALNQRDYPIVSGINICFAIFIIFTNIMVDLSYGYIDPRIHYR